MKRVELKFMMFYALKDSVGRFSSGTSDSKDSPHPHPHPQGTLMSKSLEGSTVLEEAKCQGKAPK